VITTLHGRIRRTVPPTGPMGRDHVASPVAEQRSSFYRRYRTSIDSPTGWKNLGDGQLSPGELLIPDIGHTLTIAVGKDDTPRTLTTATTAMPPGGVDGTRRELRNREVVDGDRNGGDHRKIGGMSTDQSRRQPDKHVDQLGMRNRHPRFVLPSTRSRGWVRVVMRPGKRGCPPGPRWA
jgi:hypothetical protein